jgi:FkbM family methyltransferase
MRNTMLDRVISTMRPLRVRGKGFVFDCVTPHEGIRHAAVAGAYTMRLDLANIIHRQIYMGCFANAMTRWARALLQAGGTFLDVGAHAGYFSLIAAERVGRGGRVFAIEPNPAVFSALRAHLTGNGISHADACNWGLAERAGSAALYVPPSERARDYNATLLRRPDWTVVDTPVRRLDDCLDDWGVQRVDLMKIDVEGAEPRVLAGGAAHLANGVVQHAMIEINGPRLVEAGSSPAALVENLTALGFEPARVVGGRAVCIRRTDLDLDPAHERDCLFAHRTALGADPADEPALDDESA